MKSGRRPSFPIEFKEKAAALECEPGLSVSELAREHDLNTNMLFRWRSECRRDILCAPAEMAPALLPVSLTEAVAPMVELPNPAT